MRICCCTCIHAYVYIGIHICPYVSVDELYEAGVEKGSDKTLQQERSEPEARERRREPNEPWAKLHSSYRYTVLVTRTCIRGVDHGSNEVAF